jgi:hypothetical protein
LGREDACVLPACLNLLDVNAAGSVRLGPLNDLSQYQPLEIGADAMTA